MLAKKKVKILAKNQNFTTTIVIFKFAWHSRDILFGHGVVRILQHSSHMTVFVSIFLQLGSKWSSKKNELGYIFGGTGRERNIIIEQNNLTQLLAKNKKKCEKRWFFLSFLRTIHFLSWSLPFLRRWNHFWYWSAFGFLREFFLESVRRLSCTHNPTAY